MFLQYQSIYSDTNELLVGPQRNVALVKPNGHSKYVLQLAGGELVSGT